MQTKIAIKREQSQARLSYAEREQFGATLNFIYSLAATFITAAVTLGSFTACSNEDMVAEPNTTQAQTYTVSIPASMDDDAETRAVTFDAGGTENPTAVSSFKTSDKIYVYNQKKDAMLTGYLTPSADGKTCDLEGTLTGDIAAGDELVLLYNLSNYESDKTLCNFDYDSQDGTPAGVTDGAMATVTVDSYTGSGVLTTTTTAHFQNVQSMFRFQFTSNGTPVNVKSLVISSMKNALSNFYKPLIAGYFCTDIPVILSSATTNPIYVALCIDESVAAGDVLTFEVVDADNKLYTTTKNAPSTGFVNGKYYYNSSAIDLGASVLQLVKPTLSRSDGGKDSELAVVGALRFFEINSPSISSAGTGTGINMSISGTSTGYGFVLYSEAGNTINISGLTAIYDDEYDCIYSYESLTLNISGDNTITCKNYGSCVSAFNFSTLCNLKLSGNGTLTVTSDKANWCGLYGTNYSSDNNDYDKTDEIDVSTQLAADGYTVTRSARSDNSDGTFTWTYTVIPGTKIVNLSNINANYTAQDGDILTGTLASNLKLKIAAGATVTLAGMTHHAGASINSIECLGTANIILAEGTTNDLTRGSSDAHAGLFLNNGTTWSTLTISGTGTLLASGGNACAGIGGINYCDDIVINGGTIYATGGQFAPGIGAGADSGQTGNITINGGNITATGGEGAAGIGAGTNSSYCKDITIENTVTSVTAIKGAGANESIGRGSEGSSCGTVKFGTATMFDDSRWTTTPNSGNNYGLLHFVISTTTNANDTWTLTPLNQGQGGLQDYNVNPATEQ